MTWTPGPNPFPADPDAPVDITDFRYVDKLHLVRHETARAGSTGSDWQLTKDYRVTFRLNGQPAQITAPRGMFTDLASVPRILRWYASQVGPHLEVSIIHDFLYMAWTDYRDLDGARRADHDFADDLMLAGMRAVPSIGGFKRTMIHTAVNSFVGWSIFRDKDETLETRMNRWLPLLDGVGIP